MAMTGNRTSESFWTARWSRSGRSDTPVDPEPSGLGNSVHRAYHRYFETAFADLDAGATSLIEVGCARSRWLPYFQRHFGFEISGLDYSERGCEQAREILSASGVVGDVVHADLFAPPDDLIGRFGVVASFGVVEHFDDTASCLHACAKLLKPGGRMVTFIPNMRGSVGLLQRLLSPTTYNVHVPLTPAELKTAHQRVDLEVLNCRYLMAANWGVVHVGERRAVVRSMMRHSLSLASKTIWSFERVGLRLPPNRMTSPYIACTAIKPI